LASLFDELALFFICERQCLNRIDANMVADEELNSTLFNTYVFLIKTGKPVGPRDLMRGANLSSPSVAYRNLQRLMDLDLVTKDEYGNYTVKKKLGMKGYIWLGRMLIPRFAVFGFIFVGILIAEIAVLIPHLLAGSPIEESFWLLTLVTIVSATVFLSEAVYFRLKSRH
jgi:hypothetical protein